MDNFPFGEIIKKAWVTTFKNVKLWWLGLFVGGTFSFSLPNVDSFQNDVKDSIPNLQNAWSEISQNWGLMLLLFAAGLIFIAGIWIITLIARGGLVSGLESARKNESYKFWSLVGIGAKKFPQLLLMDLMYALPVIVLMIIALAVFPWNDPISPRAFWTLIPPFFLMFFYAIFIGFFKVYSYFFAVVENKSAWISISSSFELFKKHPGKIILTMVITIGLMFALMFAIFIGMLILAIPFVLLVGLGVLIGKWFFVVTGILAVIVSLVAMLAVKGISSVYFHSYYFNAFQELKK